MITNFDTGKLTEIGRYVLLIDYVYLLFGLLFVILYIDISNLYEFR